MAGGDYIDADARAAQRYGNGHDHDDPLRHLEHYSAASLSIERVRYDGELIEGVIVRESLAVLYGESHSGKTFLAVDIGAAVAEGIRWHGRNVEQGLVLYLATESPRSVQKRLIAYRMETGRTLAQFEVVKSPVNLYASDADTTALLALVQEVESEHGAKVALIIGDTLARLSAGANENSGEDMGVVLGNVQKIIDATGAAFLLIHHTGKDTAKGMRGWSGLRAAVDTEIEVTAPTEDGPRTAEITKQRDLGTTGDRIGFRLRVVDIGMNQWGGLVTTCVVIGADAPDKPMKAKRVGAIQGAVVEYLRTKAGAVRRPELVKHFETQYDRGSVYRAIKALVEAGVLIEAAGMVGASQAARG